MSRRLTLNAVLRQTALGFEPWQIAEEFGRPLERVLELLRAHEQRKPFAEKSEKIEGESLDDLYRRVSQPSVTFSDRSLRPYMQKHFPILRQIFESNREVSCAIHPTKYEGRVVKWNTDLCVQQAKAALFTFVNGYTMQDAWEFSGIPLAVSALMWPHFEATKDEMLAEARVPKNRHRAPLSEEGKERNREHARRHAARIRRGVEAERRAWEDKELNQLQEEAESRAAEGLPFEEHAKKFAIFQKQVDERRAIWDAKHNEESHTS